MLMPKSNKKDNKICFGRCNFKIVFVAQIVQNEVELKMYRYLGVQKTKKCHNYFKTISFKSERHFFFLSERDNEYPCSTLIFATLLYTVFCPPSHPHAYRNGAKCCAVECPGPCSRRRCI